MNDTYVVKQKQKNFTPHYQHHRAALKTSHLIIDYVRCICCQVVEHFNPEHGALSSNLILPISLIVFSPVMRNLPCFSLVSCICDQFELRKGLIGKNDCRLQVPCSVRVIAEDGKK